MNAGLGQFARLLGQKKLFSETTEISKIPEISDRTSATKIMSRVGGGSLRSDAIETSSVYQDGRKVISEHFNPEGYWGRGMDEAKGKKLGDTQQSSLHAPSITPTRKVGRPKVPFSPKLSPQTQHYKLKSLHKKILNCVNKILSESECDLVKRWKDIYSNFFIFPTAVEAQIDRDNDNEVLSRNIEKLYSSIPINSPVRSALFTTLFEGVSLPSVSKITGLTVSGVYKARDRKANSFDYYIRSLGIPRDKLGQRELLLLDWFREFCIVPSGRHQRVFFGTFIGMFLEYFTWASIRDLTPVSPLKLQQIRKRENILLIAGDKFVNKRRIRLNQMPELKENIVSQMSDACDSDTIEKLEKDITGLKNEEKDIKEEIEFAEKRKRLYIADHMNLEHEPRGMVTTWDFTSSQTSMTDDFISFVGTFATHNPINIPPSLSALQIESEVPPNNSGSVHIEMPERNVKRRRKKKEMTDLDRPTKKPNLRSDISQQKKKKKLSVIEQAPSKWKPSLLYIHFICKKRRDKSVKQTADYVIWALNLLNGHGFFNDFDFTKFWSDGCGKHFKTYTTPAYVALLNEIINTKLTWDFLAPHEAHNSSDAAAAHWKGAQLKYIKNNFSLSELSHIAFSCCKLKSTLLFEAVYEDFPELLSFEPVGEPWMHNAFSFSFGEWKTEDVLCQHRHKNPRCISGNCNHQCCVPKFYDTVSFEITMRDGTVKICKIRSTLKKYPPSNLQELEEDSFWERSRSAVYRTPMSSVRVSQKVNDNDFQYASEVDDSDASDYDEYHD